MVDTEVSEAAENQSWSPYYGSRQSLRHHVKFWNDSLEDKENTNGVTNTMGVKDKNVFFAKDCLED